MTKNRKLLFSVTKKDLKIEYFSGTGAGGQKRNKCQNCVRMIHVESGAGATGQSNKERSSNLREAFLGLIKDARFRTWQQQKIEEIRTGQTINQRVEEMMSPENLKVEFRGVDGQWQEGVDEN